MKTKSDPLKPSATLLIKLGSAFVHAQEILEQRRGPMLDAHTLEFDLPAFETSAHDPEVEAWIKEMGPFLPLKRSTRS